MSEVLIWLRYVLIVIPGIGTMFSTEIDSYAAYTTCILLSILWVRLREQWFSTARWALLIEIGYVGYLGIEYGGILFLLLLSTMLSVMNTTFEKEWKLFVTGLMGVVMNLSIWLHPFDMKMVANVIFFSIAALLYAMDKTDHRNRKMENLYDELSRKHYELEEARLLLLDYAKRVEDYAQVEERNRISREIHDNLGHRLIRLKMMMEAAIQISPIQPEKAMDMITQVRDQLTDSMETLRTTVRGMSSTVVREKPYSLDQLTEKAWADSGIKVTYQVKGMPTPLYPSLEFILYRNAQEAITNAIRHGEATEIGIMLVYHPQSIELKVSNNGKLPENNLYHKGLGLRGMEERIALLGGRLQIESDRLFTVTTYIPLQSNQGSKVGGAVNI